ncbi:MAG: phosphate signaling complex protein PhoU [Firmicutes bacterium]|nr:phosphate signaling complex protein PhoU [Bacillota bacterium]
MNSKFKEQLTMLNSMMIKMGSRCEDAISIAIIGLLNDDEELIERVFKIEDEIDQMEKEIETTCMKLLLNHQSADKADKKDMRIISAALKMITDMERIGDQAEDIAEISKYLTHNDVKNKIHLKEMAETASRMVTDSINSFVNKNLELALKVVKEDDVLDDLFEQVKRELIDLIHEDKDNGEFCLDLLMIAKYLERIGDHATNIGEWVEFMITGVHNSYN